MRQTNLTVIKGGINRLRQKGAARADSLYDLLNGYVTASGTVRVRPGTFRDYQLPVGTFGLCAFAGKFHVFATEAIGGLPEDFDLHVLRSPSDVELKTIHFAEPFLGALYVVAEFVDGGIYHYWLQEAEPWQANHEYSANEFVRPAVNNGYVYRAARLGDPNPSWAPNVPREVGDLVEPTVYNEYYYEAVETNGDSPRSASVEPVWPTNTGEQIVENSETQEPDENTSVSSPPPPSSNQPQTDILAKYRGTIGGSGSLR